MSASIERGRTPADQFRWFLDICVKGMESNGTIVCFREEDGEHSLIRQSFTEIGEVYDHDFSKRAEAVKRASEAFLIEKGVCGVGVAVEDIITGQANEESPVMYKRVSFCRIKS